MMTSSGSGAYRVGGLGSLSSSSNLSPLAAPFRVEKSLQKHNSTNTSVTYPDVPMYSPYFDPTVQPWNHSSLSATGSQFADPKSMGSNNTCTSPPVVYGYSGSQPSAPVASGGVYDVTSGSAAAYDPFSYDPFPNPMSNASQEGVKSYFSPYVSAPPQKDGYLSLGVSSGHSIDLSNSSTSHLGNCGSSASDHLQGRPADGDNKRNWGSFWSGENQQEKWLEYAQGFSSKVSNQSHLPSSKTPFPVGGISKNQPSTVIHTQPFVDGGGDNIPDGANKSNLKQDGCFDIFGGAYCLGSLGITQPDNRSPLDCSRLPPSVSPWKPKETSHFQDPVVQSVTNFCGSQKANGSLGDHFGQNNFYVFGSTTATSTFPITIDNSSYGVSGSSAEVTVSALKANTDVGVEAYQSNVSARHEYSYPIEAPIPLGLKRQSRIVIRRPPPSSVTPSSSSSQKRETLDSSIGCKDVSDKGQLSPQRPQHLSPIGLDLKVNDSQAANSVEKLSWGSDVHNPAEDSPCWRGASSNRFSPFAVSEAMTQDGFTQKLDEWKSLNTQISQIKSGHIDTSDFRDFFSEKVEEGNLIARPLVPECVSKDNGDKCYPISQPFCFDLNARDGLQVVDGSFVSTKESGILNKSKTDLFPGITPGAKQISGGTEIPFAAEISETVASEGSVKFPLAAANDALDAPSNSGNNQASSPPGDTASLKHCQFTSNVSDTTVDVNMLLKAMTNLSEIFRSYCFSKRGSVPEQYPIAIKRVVANLNASMLMMAGETSSTIPFSDVNSSKKDLSDVQMVNKAAFEALAAAVKLGGTTEGLLDSVSCMDNPLTNEDGNMTESIKKILNEDFPVEEEMDQQKLLYRSLWLDAEASLCTMTAKARLLRVKAEMERTHDVTKDGEIPLSSDKSSDVHCEVPELNKCHAPNARAVPMNPMESEGQTHFTSLHSSKRDHAGNDSDGSGSTSNKNNVEASVLARYQILKTRIESSEGPSQENKEPSGGHIDPILAKYQMLTCRVDQESMNHGRNSPPGDDNYLPDRESSSPVYQILESRADITDSLYVPGDSQNSQLLSNSVGVSEIGEDSIIARFRIIQNRINHPETVKVLEDGINKLGFSELENNALRTGFGPYPEFIEDEDEDVNQYCNSNRLNGEIFEDWYANDVGSSSDWEHV